MAIFVPQGLGIGANVETHANQQAAHAQAMRVLAPRWSYTWSRLAVGPNYVPAIFPEWKIIPAHDLAVWRVQMIDAGLQWDQLTWTFCNEPENSNMEPREIARAIVRQLVEFDNANIRLRVMTPNNNINTQRSLNFGIDLFQRTRQAGVLLAPACHVWCGAQYVPQVWARYREWIEGYGDKLDAITITEAGPGPMCSMAEWLEFMPLAYALLDDPRVGGLAPFSAYPKIRDGMERHPGFMLPDGTLTPLGVQYKAEMIRRATLADLPRAGAVTAAQVRSQQD